MNILSHPETRCVPYTEGLRPLMEQIVKLYARSGWGTNYEIEATHQAFLRAATLIALRGSDEAPMVVGFLRGFTDHQFVAWVGEVVVDQDEKRQRIGSALVDKFVAECGAQAVYLEALDGSRAFFRAKGFKEQTALTAMSMRVASANPERAQVERSLTQPLPLR